MYEEKKTMADVIGVIVLIIFAFFFIPWLLSLGDSSSSSQESNRFEDSSIYQP